MCSRRSDHHLSTLVTMRLELCQPAKFCIGISINSILRFSLLKFHGVPNIVSYSFFQTLRTQQTTSTQYYRLKLPINFCTIILIPSRSLFSNFHSNTANYRYMAIIRHTGVYQEEMNRPLCTNIRQENRNKFIPLVKIWQIFKLTKSTQKVQFMWVMVST